MYRNQRIIATICARGGSRGVPGKNIKRILGKPLLVYTLEQVQALSWIDRIVVSTDDAKIQRVARKAGIEVPFLRPKKYATNTASKLPAIINTVQKAERLWQETYDVVLDLDPTSPLRTLKDIEDSVKLLLADDKTLSVFSVCQAAKNPYFNMVEPTSRGYVRLSKKPPQPLTRRQDAPPVYSMNASIYVMRKNDLFERKTFFTERTKAYLMPEERSVDIDRPLDFEFVSFMLERATRSQR